MHVKKGDIVKVISGKDRKLPPRKFCRFSLERTRLWSQAANS